MSSSVSPCQPSVRQESFFPALPAVVVKVARIARTIIVLGLTGLALYKWPGPMLGVLVGAGIVGVAAFVFLRSVASEVAQQVLRY